MSGPPPPPPGGAGSGDVVQVWLVPDQRSERVLAALLAVLDAGERLRAESYRSDEDRRRFIVAHGAIRHIVAGQLGAPPRQIRWTSGPHGKPELAGRWRGAQVNLSHSGGIAMVAVTRSRRVGVDVQQVRPQVDAAAMAHRYFLPAEARLVGAAPDAEDRAERFARLWARKEALVKAHGGRLAQGLRIQVTGAAPTAAHRTEDAWSTSYRITDVAAPPGYRAAVALADRAGFRVSWHRWTWPGPTPGPPPP